MSTALITGYFGAEFLRVYIISSDIENKKTVIGTQIFNTQCIENRMLQC